MSRTDRRKFLAQGLAAATAIVVLPRSTLREVPRVVEQPVAGKKVIIAGGGIAGLVSAFELKQAGYDVTVLEARTRPGGRIYTLREPFAEGLHAEGGATRINREHNLTLKYAKLFGLTLAPFYPRSGHFISLNKGRRREEGWKEFSSEVNKIIYIGDSRDWFKIEGGNDALPFAFAKRLEGAIIYDAPVVSIEQDAKGVTVGFKRAGTLEKMRGEYLISAMPFSTLRRVAVSPQFPAAKRKIIEEMKHDSASRVFLQVRTRFWQQGRANGFAVADQAIEIWDSSLDQPGTRGILQTYLRRDDSEKLRALKEEERLRVSLERMEQVFPGTRANFESGVTKCWSDDEWSLGAWVHFDEKALPLVTRPEGRIYFAGDHTSRRPSWMQGALESGLRVVKEITEAAQAAAG